MANLGRLEEALMALRAAGKSATKAGKEKFSSLVSTPSQALESPGLLREFPAGQLAVPDQVFDITGTKSSFSEFPKQMRNTVLGQYDTLNNEVKYNRFSNLFEHPGYTGQALGTASHEFGHALQNQPDKLVNSAFDATIKPNAEILAINKFLRSPSDPGQRASAFRMKDALPEEEFQKAVYSINPLETSMKSLGGLAQGSFKSPEEVTAFRNAYPKLYAEANKRALNQFKAEYPSAAKLATPFIQDYLPGAAIAGTAALGYELAKPDESEAGPVNLKNLWRGTAKVSKEITSDNIARELYNLKPRAAYRAIDNPVGAAQFGDVFPVEMNFQNLFDVRYDPQEAIKIAKLAEERAGLDPRKTVRNLLTGNWDAFELGESNYDKKLGVVQQAIKDLGYSGNWQLEPTKFQKSEWDQLHPFVNRRYQDVYATFAKPEIKIGDKVYGQTELFDATQKARGLTLPKYKGGEELPIAEARKEIAPLIDPVVLYNDEAMKFFHPDFKPMLEEFRPDAHFLDPNYEMKNLFPPPREGFSLQSVREKTTPINDYENEKPLSTAEMDNILNNALDDASKKFKDSLKTPFSPSDGKFNNHMNYAMEQGKFPSSFEATPESLEKFLKWEQNKVAGLSDDKVQAMHDKTINIYDLFENKLGVKKVKDVMDNYYEKSTSANTDGWKAVEDANSFDSYGLSLVNPNDSDIPKFAKSNDFKAFITGNYDLTDVEFMHKFTYNGEEVQVPDHLLGKVEKELAKNLGVDVGDIGYEDIGKALEDANKLYTQKGVSKLPPPDLNFNLDQGVPSFNTKSTKDFEKFLNWMDKNPKINASDTYKEFTNNLGDSTVLNVQKVWANDKGIQDVSDFVQGKYKSKMGEVHFNIDGEKIPESVYTVLKNDIASIHGIDTMDVQPEEISQYLKSMTTQVISSQKELAESTTEALYNNSSSQVEVDRALQSFKSKYNEWPKWYSTMLEDMKKNTTKEDFSKVEEYVNKTYYNSPDNLVEIKTTQLKDLLSMPLEDAAIKIVDDPASKISFADLKATKPDLADAVHKYMVKTGIASAALGTTALSLTGESQAMSKNDKTMEPSIPANVMLGNPEEGLISEGLKKLPKTSWNLTKAAAKALGELAWTGAKSAKKLATGGKGIGETPVSLEDIGNVVSTFFNPMTKAGLSGTAVLSDLLLPGELNAGEFDPARLER